MLELEPALDRTGSMSTTFDLGGASSRMVH